MLDGREHGGIISADGRQVPEARVAYTRILTAANSLSSQIDAAARKFWACTATISHLPCASQQCDASRAVCFLGRFLPKLGGALCTAIFLVRSATAPGSRSDQFLFSVAHF